MTVRISARRWLGAAGALALAAQPQLAQAQQCVSEDEVSAMAIYAVPGLIQGAQLGCGNRLSANGFLAREGAALAGRYAPLQTGAWPGAKAGLLKLVASGAQSQALEGMDMIANLPDDSVRPLVDALIVQKISQDIRPDSCGRIERVVEALAPIEPEVVGSLLGVVAGLVGLDNPTICPVGE